MKASPPSKLCAHFGPCGGCSFLDRQYEFQLERKRITVESEIRKVPDLQKFVVPPVLGDPFPYYYRNKAIYPFARAGAKTLAGFYRRGSHSIVDVKECQIQDPSLTEMANRVREIVAKDRVPIYDERRDKGFLRAMLLRVGVTSGEMMVGLVTKGGIYSRLNPIASQIVQAGKGLRTRSGQTVRVVSVMRNIQNAKSNVILGPKSLPLRGDDFFFDSLGPLKFQVSLPSFFQVNSSQAMAAYRLASEFAGEAKKGRVVDAFAGIGTISLWFAKEAQEVIGLEEVPEAVQDAQRNAKLNQISNCHFEVGRVESTLPKIRGKVDLLILDPPRSGCSESVLETIAKVKPKKLVYISCSAQTLARDLAFLTRRGFNLKQLQPVDFFPHTEHNEVVTALES